MSSIFILRLFLNESVHGVRLKFFIIIIIFKSLSNINKI